MEMTEPHPATLEEEQLLRQCEVVRGRTGGPGGQHRNKVETAIELRHRETGIVAHGSERRSQALNLHRAAFRLRVNLALAVRRPIDPMQPPSEMWRSRLRRDGRIELNPKHQDFPAMLAEALDTLAALHADVHKAGMALGCSTSQLLKLLKHEPRAMDWLNEQRQMRGLKPMR